MKKRIVTAMLAAAMTVSFAACGASGQEETQIEDSTALEDMSFDEMVEEAKGFHRHILWMGRGRKPK